MLEDIEVGVIGYNIFSIDGYGAIYELVVVRICLNQSEVVVNTLKNGSVQSYDSLDYIASYLSCGLLDQNLLIFIENIRVDTQTDTASHYLSPYLVIRATRG